jgi:hypothetical protein
MCIYIYICIYLYVHLSIDETEDTDNKNYPFPPQVLRGIYLNKYIYAYKDTHIRDIDIYLYTFICR